MNSCMNLFFLCFKFFSILHFEVHLHQISCHNTEINTLQIYTLQNEHWSEVRVILSDLHVKIRIMFFFFCFDPDQGCEHGSSLASYIAQATVESGIQVQSLSVRLITSLT